MSGPSLNKLDAHKSIHDGTLTEGRDLLELLYKFMAENKEKEANLTAEALVEHFETRTLAHASAEEEGFYDQKVKENPKHESTVNMLKRDHDLLRKIHNEIKEILENDGVTNKLIDRFKSFLLINEMHSRDEEAMLLNNSEQNSAEA